MKLVLSALTAIAALFVGAATYAQDVAAPSSTKPVMLVVSFPPGGGIDPIARILSAQLSQRWKTTVIVSNRPGAGGHIGDDFVSRSEPDGHTLLVTTNGFPIAAHVLSPGAQKPADAVTDFTPIAQISTTPMLLLAHPDLKVTDAKELVERVKRGADLSFASPGNGSPMHIAGELFKKAAGVKITHVPYRGLGPALNDVLGGHIKVIFLGLPAAKAHIDAGKLVPLAILDTKRSPLMPNLRTLGEQGFSGADVDIWFGVYGPKNMPKPLAEGINKTINEILREPEVAAQLKGMSQLAITESTETFANKTRSDYKRYGELVREFKIQAD